MNVGMTCKEGKVFYRLLLCRACVMVHSQGTAISPSMDHSPCNNLPCVFSSAAAGVVERDPKIPSWPFRGQKAI